MIPQIQNSKRLCTTGKFCPVNDSKDSDGVISACLGKTNGLFCDLLDKVGDEVMLIDPNGRIVFVNNAAVESLGFPEKQILGASILSFMRQKMTLVDWNNKFFLKVKNKQTPLKLVLERVTSAKEIRFVQTSISYLKSIHGEFLLSMGRDITDNYLLQKQLKQSEYKYRLLSECSGDGIVLVKYDWTLLYANPEAERILKLKRYNLSGVSFKDFVSKDSLEKVREYLSKIQKNQVPTSAEFLFIDLTGKVITVEALASKILYNGQRDCVIFVFRDVTSRKHFEALIRESDKMRAVQSLITGTVKEIQLPIKGMLHKTQQVIENYSQRDFEYIGYKEFKNLFDSIKGIKVQLQNCFYTTSKLIDLNKKKVGLHNGVADVNVCIEEAVNVIKHQLEILAIDLKFQFSFHLPKVSMGASEMQEIIVNLITNSIQSIQTKGKIIIRTGYVKNKRMVKIEIEDNGEGISKDVLPHVFEPFFTTRQRGLDKNSGLGLSIVYTLLQANHGDIQITSSWKKGTLVTVWVPMCQAEKK